MLFYNSTLSLKSATHFHSAAKVLFIVPQTYAALWCLMVISRTQNLKVDSSKLGFTQNKILKAGLWFSVTSSVYEAKYTHYIRKHYVNCVNPLDYGIYEQPLYRLQHQIHQFILWNAAPPNILSHWFSVMAEGM